MLVASAQVGTSPGEKPQSECSWSGGAGKAGRGWGGTEKPGSQPGQQPSADSPGLSRVRSRVRELQGWGMVWKGFPSVNFRLPGFKGRLRFLLTLGKLSHGPGPQFPHV